MLRFLVVSVSALLLAAAPASALRATRHLDLLEAALANRTVGLAGATDKLEKKQLKAAEKALARIAVDTESLAEDLQLAKKIAGPLEKAYSGDAQVIDLLGAAADAFEVDVAARADALARARAPLPEAKLTKKADRLLRKAGKLRDKAATQGKLKKRLSLLGKAQKAADKASAVLADALGEPAPTRLVVSPASALLTAPGETVTLRAVVLDQLDRPMPGTVSFSSANPDVAMVTGTGVVSGGAVGSAQVFAAIGELETAVTIVNARPAPGAILVEDSRVATMPEPLDEGAEYGVGFRYTVELFGEPPLVGDLLVGTGEIPLGGLVVDVVGADPTFVTLEVRPLDELFADLAIDETIDSNPENLDVPADVLEHYHVESGEDGAYVFVPRDDAPPPLESEPRRRPRGGVQGTTTTSALGPFVCRSEFTAQIGLNAPPTFSVTPGVSVDFQYSSEEGLQRLVATGGATVSFSYKPRIQAAFQGKLTCKARVLGLTISVPGPIAFIVGGYVPIGVGLEVSGTVTFAQFGFDAAWSDSFSVRVGVDCASGACEPVAEAPDPAPPATPPPPPLQLVLPNVISDFNVAVSLSAFGYFELKVGNPLWEYLQVSLVEGRAGIELSGNFAPRVSQFANATSASSYKLALFAKVGAGVSINDILQLFSLNVNLAMFELKGAIDLANSPTAATAPDGSLAFDGPVTQGDEVVARVILKDTTFLGLLNVDEVRIYRRDGVSSELKATIPGADGTTVGEGFVEYTGTWTATFFDPGSEFGVVVKTLLPILEFEIENDSLRTLEEGEGEDAWTAAVTFPLVITEETDEDLVVVVNDENGEPVAGASVELAATGGTTGVASGTTGADGRFATTARLAAGETELAIDVTVRDGPGGEVRATETVIASTTAGSWAIVERFNQVTAGIGTQVTDTDQAGPGEGGTEATVDQESGGDRAFANSSTDVIDGGIGLVISAGVTGFVQGAGEVSEMRARVVFEVLGGPVPYRFVGDEFSNEGAGSASITLDGEPAADEAIEGFLEPGVHTLEIEVDLQSGDRGASSGLVLGENFPV